MIVTANVIACSGIAVSAIALFSLTRNSEYMKAALAFTGVALIVGIATQFHVVTLTASEMTLVWFLPALAAVDINRRTVPVALVLVLFVFAALAHWLFFNPWLPLAVALAAAVLMTAPVAREEFAVGDRVMVVWLLYAFGLLGLVASAVAFATAMGRKNVPYIAHAACATAVLLVPLAAVLAHVGILPWRF